MKSNSRNLLLLLFILQCFFSIPQALSLARHPSLFAKTVFERSRGHAMTSPVTTPSAVARGGANDEKKEETPKTTGELQDEAINNIDRVSRMAFAAGVADTASFLWEAYKREGSLLKMSLLEQGKLCTLLWNFVFGLAIRRAGLIFRQSRGVDRMSPQNFLKLSQTLLVLWLGVAAAFGMDLVIMAEELAPRVPNIEAICYTAFVGMLLVGDFVHQGYVKAEKASEVATDYAPGRKAGLRTARSMIWGVGACAVFLLLDLARYSTDTFHAVGAAAKAEAFFGGFLEWIEPWFLIGLLASLYKSYMRSALYITKKSFNPKDPSFREYFDSQTKFYGYLANFFWWQVLFTGLGYVYQFGEKLVLQFA